MIALAAEPATKNTIPFTSHHFTWGSGRAGTTRSRIRKAMKVAGNRRGITSMKVIGDSFLHGRYLRGNTFVTLTNAENDWPIQSTHNTCPSVPRPAGAGQAPDRHRRSEPRHPCADG